jgi:hypothetical protein
MRVRLSAALSMVRVWRSWGARMGSKMRFVWERWEVGRREKGRLRFEGMVVVIEVGFEGMVGLERRGREEGRMCILAVQLIRQVCEGVGSCVGKPLRVVFRC